ncbi:efflux RND transporter periplasmic adaptor subunit [Idiomarina loihiensis]|jgi:membrane fusion protein (multidrug efflux system)|uniref:Probable acriflavine resistance protein A, RND family efflux system component n=1 Tax=Idiomarina loihiensis (strain ATCC BAA-735 / DSM 15497 / L2-TR) TaxID=283942 RepID=Q5R0E8_IDILO|nr:MULTISPECIES: efflux RND transporter periplasmic adaptor subunit [Idiomarina]AAV81542.1 Probable acriflavine resistance protein A, RND family efflux system component [Idiomarina loihiensis L2TR]AGM35570.1 acriflavin resistance protein A [Idiomarina loihiensis GSL 199]MAA63120.1 efflux RND transporter periplasmic adaptor subunit [Idiomarina sp.]MRJ43835.1 efflux RND transporter periplasmic adaptor subunit [Idiomarina loihiensis]PHQ90255.1 MAG: efflux RND transporter periplasmic adaptor subun|tara:strand:+ start:34012 stop:35166 length:1155 start_codon:yes stop_codon:yes gene_type:complete
MNTRFRFAPIFAASLLLTGALTACSDQQQQQQGQQQAAQVDVITVTPESISLSTDLPGRTAAYRVAQVRPQVSGVLLKRTFEEGTFVEKGQQLYQIDPAVYEAELASAKAEVESAKAVLRSSELRYKRFQELLEENAVSQDEFDSAEATFYQNKAAVSVAEAQLKNARINLEYTKVNAPINGVIGRSNFTEGALLTASQTEPLVTINQLDPIYVDINQSSKQFMELQADIKSGRIQANEKGNAPVRLKLNGLDYDQKGELLFSEVSVDEDTGAILLRAEFPNPDKTLYPGMFVRAEVSEGTINSAIKVPQTAVTRDPRGRPYVMLVNDDKKVEQRMITTERAVGSSWLVSEGLKEGDTVITSGLQKIRPGASVTIDSSNSEQQQ